MVAVAAASLVRGVARASKLEQEEDQEGEQPEAARPPRRPVAHLADGAGACGESRGVTSSQRRREPAVAVAVAGWPQAPALVSPLSNGEHQDWSPPPR